MMIRLLPLLFLLLLSGCSMQEPADTSDPAASKKWIAHCLKEAGKTSGTMKASWLVNAYEFAKKADLVSAQEEQIPQQVLQLGRQTKNFSAFNWAIDHGAEPPVQFGDLLAYRELGREWRDKVVQHDPDTLPVFMSLAVDQYDRKFFREHAAEFMKYDFDVPQPLEKTEFRIRYRRFLGVQLQEALDKQDEEKIRFFISVTPKLENVSYLDKAARESMQATGDFVLQTLKDDALLLHMLELNWPLNPIDFSNPVLSEEFLEAYRAKPEYVIRTQGLEEWDGPMSPEEARFLTTLPEEAWALLPKLHFDELTEESVKMVDTDAAARVIAFKAAQKPLTQADYNELVNWALMHGNKSVFEFVIRESGELDLFNIDFAALAENQKLFEMYAPKIMSHIYYTLDTEPREDGVTIGNIKRVFGAKNEKAGLWLVHKYDLSEPWAKATEGQTLLMDVCEMGNLLATRYLVEKRGENVRQQTGYTQMQVTMFGNTKPTEGKLSPIFFAAKSGNSELIKYLVSKGANVNARSNYRATPLMYAVSAGKVGAVKTLIGLHADVNAEMNPNLQNMDLRELGIYHEISNPYRRAMSTHNEEIQRILRAAGGRP
ncbi:ankyrin repeat domain-containing protein [Pontiella agarivorans]|uniref:Ankyrin repeat domain-containing protein n=1 Tax=Pontiella agarivorans TaxID=3038953 RepID=A0ABU5MZZ5_9BACT|nr:ankyrin repeat domain-containing protein [Pontiella agarivorans]MDZ8119744.1 ankyrin repeat domain-containing protein [Pontiella agarivorans]